MNEPASLTAVVVLNIGPDAVDGRITVEGVERRRLRSETDLIRALEAVRELVAARALAA